MGTAGMLAWARAGDGEAFRELTGPHRRELQVHCYRMPGSFAGAEDAVQETMLAAWQGIGGFTGERASLRTWLYKIATSRCLAARRAAGRRPARQRDMPASGPPAPVPRDEAAGRGHFPARSWRAPPVRRPAGSPLRGSARVLLDARITQRDAGQSTDAPGGCTHIRGPGR